VSGEWKSKACRATPHQETILFTVPFLKITTKSEEMNPNYEVRFYASYREESKITRVLDTALAQCEQIIHFKQNGELNR